MNSETRWQGVHPHIGGENSAAEGRPHLQAKHPHIGEDTAAGTRTTLVRGRTAQTRSGPATCQAAVRLRGDEEQSAARRADSGSRLDHQNHNDHERDEDKGPSPVLPIRP